MHLLDPKINYLPGLRDTAIACCVLREEFREALTNSKNVRFAVGYCAYGILMLFAILMLMFWRESEMVSFCPHYSKIWLLSPV